jgi:hypothetical protein
MPDAAPSVSPSAPQTASATHEVALILSGGRLQIPGYWNLELEVQDPPSLIFADGSPCRRTPLEVRARQAFEEHRDILSEGNYRISLGGDPATIDFFELMRAKILVSEGHRPIEIVIVEEQDVVAQEPAPGEPPGVLERRRLYRRLGHPDARLPEGMLVFDLSDDGGRDEGGHQIPVEIPGARVIGWSGLRNQHRLLHESYALAAAESLIARAAHLGARDPEKWGIYVGREAQRAVAVLRTSRGFYAGRMIPILVRQQWRHDVPGEAPSWRPLRLRLLDASEIA